MIDKNLTNYVSSFLSDYLINDNITSITDANDINLIYESDAVSTTVSSYILHIIILCLYLILIFTSLTSNPLLIYILLWKRKTQLKLIDVYVTNLSISDLFLTIFNIPLCLTMFFSGQWPFGTLMCKLGIYSTSITIYVNIFTMAYISIDRYFAIIKPFKIQKTTNMNNRRLNSTSLNRSAKRKIYIALSVIWLIAITLSLPQFIFIKMSNHQTGDTAVDNDTTIASSFLVKNDESSQEVANKFEIELVKRCIQEYPFEDMTFYMVFINFSLQYLIPFLIIFTFYGRIIYHLYLNLNLQDMMPKNRTSQRSESTTKSTKSLMSSISQRGSSLIACCRADKRANKVIISDSMRVEGVKRAHNLKKSMKIMIIIIALFLLSWMPIHLYRLITTFYPLFTYSNVIPPIVSQTNVSDDPMNNSSVVPTAANCTIENFLQCFYSTTNTDESSQNKMHKGNLHNRYVYFFCHFLSMSSVCYNPIVYFWMHKKFRRDVKTLLFNISNFMRKKRKFILTNIIRSSVNQKNGVDSGVALDVVAMCSNQQPQAQQQQAHLYLFDEKNSSIIRIEANVSFNSNHSNNHTAKIHRVTSISTTI